MYKRLYNDQPGEARMPRKPLQPILALTGSLSLKQGAHVLGGADRIALLEAIHATGSVTHAAKAVGISYKTAWDRVQDMNNVAGHALVERVTGGTGGGGATLTPCALELVVAFRHLEQKHAEVLGQLSQSLSHPQDVLKTLSTLGLRTSARNQLGGTVKRVSKGEVNALVELALPSAQKGQGDTLFASLTMTSLKELGVIKGRQAVALIKAPSVFLALPDSPMRLSVRNSLQGQVSAIHTGSVNTEVQVRLKGGQTMVAMVSRDSADKLKLAQGLDVLVLFQETSVIIGVV